MLAVNAIGRSVQDKIKWAVSGIVKNAPLRYLWCKPTAIQIQMQQPRWRVQVESLVIQDILAEPKLRPRDKQVYSNGTEIFCANSRVRNSIYDFGDNEIWKSGLLNNPKCAARAKSQIDSKTEFSRLCGFARGNFSDVSIHYFFFRNSIIPSSISFLEKFPSRNSSSDLLPSLS